MYIVFSKLLLSGICGVADFRDPAAKAAHHNEGIAAVLEGAKEKPRKFLETIELQIALKDLRSVQRKLSGLGEGSSKIPFGPLA